MTTDGLHSDGRPAGQQTAATVERWLIERLADELHLSPDRIAANQPILGYGIDSMQLVMVLAQLEDRLGIRFDSNPLEDHPTIAALAQFAVDRVTGGASASPSKPDTTG